MNKPDLCPRSATGEATGRRGRQRTVKRRRTGAGPGAIRILDARDLRIHNSVSNPDDRNPVRTAWRRSSVSFVNVGRTTKISEDLLRSPCDRGEARAIDLCEYVLRPGHVADARAEGRAVRTELDLCLARTSDEHPRGFSVEIQRAQVVREGTAAAAAGGAVGVLRIVERSRERSCWPLLVPDEGGNQRSSVPITRQSRGHSSYLMKEAIGAHQYQSRGNLEVTPRT